MGDFITQAGNDNILDNRQEWDTAQAVYLSIHVLFN